MSMTETSAASPAPRQRWHDWFDVRFRTPAAIYGLIVYTALLMITSDHDDDVASTVWGSLVTLAVFFIAHVFAQTLSDHGRHPLGTATRYALTHSSGMLYAAVPPTAAMVIAGLCGQDAEDASGWALIVSTVVLGFLGWIAYSRTGAPRWARVVGALATALLGGFVAILEYAFH
ncbi:MAG: hypothetical protein NT132_01085 [Microbacterium sp.]|uniref:hypothetical protein n=1 Tax=Microbacterium sp. TaxID=51671 RepID=UPI00260958E7|nr:hypothetical protein [Microbacterium sp.]MCX6501010.1 hypothetical protein [Microbacterium sp.]